MTMKTKAHADAAPASGQHTPGPSQLRYTDTGIASRGELLEEIDRLHDCERQTSEHSQRTIDALLRERDQLLRDKAELLEVLQSVAVSVPFASYHGDGELEECEERVRTALAKYGKGDA